MRLVAVAVRDSVVGGYMRPFFAPAVGAAVRAFIDEVNRAAEDNPMFKHPADYDLFHVGFFDDVSGELVQVVPEMVARGSSSVTKGG